MGQYFDVEMNSYVGQASWAFVRVRVRAGLLKYPTMIDILRFKFLDF